MLVHVKLPFRHHSFKGWVYFIHRLSSSLWHPPPPNPNHPKTLPLMINTLTTTEAATIPSMTDSVNGSNCLSDRLMRSGLRRYLQSTTKQLCDSNLVYHCCWRSQSTLNNSNISWEFIYALWWEVFRLGMSDLITWWWLQSVDDGRL